MELNMWIGREARKWKTGKWNDRKHIEVEKQFDSEGRCGEGGMWRWKVEGEGMWKMEDEN